MGKRIRSSNIISIVFTLVIITLLILSGPVSAVDVKVKTDKSTYGGNDLVVFTASVDINTGERIPVQNLTLRISNSTDVIRTCTFSTGGTNISTCTNIVDITVLNAVGSANATGQYGYGYGYNPSSGVWNTSNETFFDSSYGFGYGYTTGYTSFSGELSFNVTWNISAESVNDGDYSVNLWAHAADSQGKSRVYSDSTPQTGNNSFAYDGTAATITITGPTGTVTTSSTTLSATTNENAQCRYSTTDQSYSEMSSTITSSLGVSHSWTLSGLTSGSKNYYIRCTDSNGNVNTNSVAAAFTVSITSAGASGGGGGGGAPSNIAGSASQTWLAIAAGKLTKMTVNKPDISFTEISFELGESSDNPSMTVRSLRDRPPNIPSPTELVFQYIEIITSKLREVRSVTMNFRVPQSWFRDNNAQNSEIALYRWVGNNWIELPTAVVTSDLSYVYFQATSSGFSYFAIGRKAVTELEPGPPPSARVVTPTAPAPTGPALTAPIIPVLTLEPKTTILWLILSIIIVSIALFAVSYGYYSERIMPKLEKQAKNYISRARAVGRKDADIREALRTANWPDRKIDKFLKNK